MKIRLFTTAVILMASTSLFAIERGLGNPNSVYVEKGTFSLGLSGSYHHYNAAHGAKLLGLVTNLDGQAAIGQAEVEAAWFVKDNTSIGVMLGYENVLADGNSLSALGILNLSNRHSRNEQYQASIGMRRYIPLFDSKMFAIFAEPRLSGARGYNKNYEETERGKEGTYTDIWSASFNVIAGVSFFFSNQTALHVSVPSFSAGMQWNKQIEGQEVESSITSKGLHASFDLLGINAGVVVFF